MPRQSKINGGPGRVVIQGVFALDRFLFLSVSSLTCKSMPPSSNSDRACLAIKEAFLENLRVDPH